MTTIEYIRYRIPEPEREDFTAAYRQAAVPLAASPYCVDYELTESVDEPGAYILRIRWTSVRDHLEGFRRSPEFAAFLVAVRPYVGAIQEMRHYADTGVSGIGAGSSLPGEGDGGDLDPDVALVLDAYRAYAAGDIDRAVAPLHPDVEWIEPEEFPGGGRRVGPAAVAAYLRASADGWSEFTSEATAHRRGEDVVVVHHVFGTLADGTPHEVTVADVFTVRDGQVVRMQAYADPKDALEERS